MLRHESITYHWYIPIDVNYLKETVNQFHPLFSKAVTKFDTLIINIKPISKYSKNICVFVTGVFIPFHWWLQWLRYHHSHNSFPAEVLWWGRAATAWSWRITVVTFVKWMEFDISAVIPGFTTSFRLILWFLDNGNVVTSVFSASMQAILLYNHHWWRVAHLRCIFWCSL